MNKIGVLASVIFALIIFVSCEKDDSETENNDMDSLIGTWELKGLVNISDEQKYLNTILEINEDKTYSNKEESGEIIASGTWNYQDSEDYIHLSYGLFEYYEIEYRLKTKESENLVLERHYTLDDKDAYLEYLYVRKD
jgi:hypothetical protein